MFSRRWDPGIWEVYEDWICESFANLRWFDLGRGIVALSFRIINQGSGISASSRKGNHDGTDVEIIWGLWIFDVFGGDEKGDLDLRCFQGVGILGFGRFMRIGSANHLLIFDGLIWEGGIWEKHGEGIVALSFRIINQGSGISASSRKGNHDGTDVEIIWGLWVSRSRLSGEIEFNYNYRRFRENRGNLGNGIMRIWDQYKRNMEFTLFCIILLETFSLALSKDQRGKHDDMERSYKGVVINGNSQNKGREGRDYYGKGKGKMVEESEFKWTNVPERGNKRAYTNRGNYRGEGDASRHRSARREDTRFGAQNEQAREQQGKRGVREEAQEEERLGVQGPGAGKQWPGGRRSGLCGRGARPGGR
ncbi:hypothetical protein F2Q69_00042769 [Brassica cretica]|uniref:Uncharacterized protein n=1 Tax=Brassica cretica TaxID=69181 RepID=A0A8S9NMN2_BRACR|nr:hypothetical protein F2Q69_00042769 [Brassica cretica]